jgi:hypothetical protein
MEVEGLGIRIIEHTAKVFAITVLLTAMSGVALGQTPTLSVVASPSSMTLAEGSSGTFTVLTTASGGFNSAVNCTASGIPFADGEFLPGATTISAPGSGYLVLQL